MDLTTALTLSFANFVTKKRYDLLLQEYKNTNKILASVNAAVLKALGCKPTTIEDILERIEAFDLPAYNHQLQQKQIKFMTIEDEAYPPLLKTIPDAPVFLYVRGNIDCLTQPAIACVGTRAMSVYGRQLTERFVPDLARSGLTIVSGLALGIDAEVAKVTLAAGGSTIAVLGNGLGSIHPVSNTQLAEQLLAQNGALVSEWPLDIVPQKYTYPARNRIVAGLCDATLVLEAGEGSGALITADLALDYNRDVYTIPGNIYTPTMYGNNTLIQKGHAQLVQTPVDILQNFGMHVAKTNKTTFTAGSMEQQTVCTALSGLPQTVEQLTNVTGLPTAIVSTQLTMLELANVAKNMGGGQWVLT